MHGIELKFGAFPNPHVKIKCLFYLGLHLHKSNPPPLVVWRQLWMFPISEMAMGFLHVLLPPGDCPCGWNDWAMYMSALSLGTGPCFRWLKGWLWLGTVTWHKMMDGHSGVVDVRWRLCLRMFRAVKIGWDNAWAPLAFLVAVFLD